MTVKDSWLFGDMLCMESWTITQCCSRSAQRNFFLKGKLRHAGQAPHAQLPCQQGERMEGAVCSHSVKLGREIRQVHNKEISQPHPGAAGRAEAVQNREFRTLSALRAVGWELKGGS